VVEGHTDGARFGAADGNYGNWELSADRANAARRVLETVGVADRRMEVRGYADTKPRVIDDPLAPANRRISILLPYTQVSATEGSAEELANSKRDSLISHIGKPIPQSPPGGN
jgi:chemotaxis protein MotB